MKKDLMLHALNLAKKGEGFVSPNPLVGAVIVKAGEIIGEGYHQKYGDAHAEVNAFLSCKETAIGAEMYVTLEPCSHYGKTPPCADRIIDEGVKKVYVAMEDPNPLVAGKGIKKLRNAGIEVEVGLYKEKAKKLNESFLKFITTKKPLVISKYAMSLDGKIATSSYDSKWITQESTRAYSHGLLRSKVDAILVGINTVIHDDPILTNRSGGKSPVRIVLDSNGKINTNFKVIKDTTSKTLVYVKDIAQEKKQLIEAKGHEVITDPTDNKYINLNFVLSDLGKRKISSLLVEGGAEINASFWEQNLVDKFYIFIGNTVIGGKSAPGPIGGLGFLKMSETFRFNIESVKAFDNNDILIVGSKGGR